MAYNIKMYKKDYGKPHITTIKEKDNNKAELINVVNAIREVANIPNDKKRNYPIKIYSDSQYAMDTLNQFLVYVKKMRGIPELYNYFKENNIFYYEKNKKFYGVLRSKKELVSCKINFRLLVFDLMKIMDTNNIKFQWIPRQENEEVDQISKMRL